MMMLAWVLALFGLNSAHAAIPIEIRFENRSEPLKNEKIWSVNPNEVNPHRRTWWLERDVVAQHWSVVPRDPLMGGGYGIVLDGVRATSRLYLRAESRWYSLITEFPCHPTPDSRFVMEEGARLAGREAAEVWKTQIERALPELELKIRQVSASSPPMATQLAEEVLSLWKMDLDEKFDAAIAQEGRKKEWSYYSQLANKYKVCSERKKKSVPHLLSWEERMEPPVGLGSSQNVTKPLFRSPARRWGGSYSIRIVAKVGDKVLNGQFLIDPSAPVSLVSPTWLEGQGIFAFMIRTPGGEPRRFQWNDRAQVILPVRFDDVSAGGWSFPKQNFYLADTDLFHPPAAIANCCDGVLGMDFLLRTTVVFDPRHPVNVTGWDRRGFAPPFEADWWEVAVGKNGELLSSCSPRGVQWKFGSAESIQFQSGLMEVSCGLSRRPLMVSREKGTKIGQAGWAHFEGTLMALDLGSGRIWAQQSKGYPLVNRTGIRLEFTFRKGERTLKVVELGNTKEAQSLVKAGLTVHREIEEINGTPVVEMDQGEVDRILGGAKGNQITLKWETPRGVFKLAPLTLR